MLDFYGFIIITILVIIYQRRVGALGKSIETFFVAIAYGLYTEFILVDRLLYAASLWVSVGLWSIYLVTLFNRRYEKELEFEETLV